MRGFLATLVLAGSCAPRPVEFPVGFFGVHTAADARRLAAEGYNALQSYDTSPEVIDAIAREARRSSALLLVSPLELMDSSAPASAYEGAWWYLFDEPDVHKKDLAAMKALEAKVRGWAPAAKTSFVVGDGRKAKDYPGVADAIMVDWYPVPHLPLESAGDHVRMTAETSGGRKVWAVLQAMDWREFSPPNPKKKPIGRFPDLAEIRFMSYDAVLAGAHGIWYFNYRLISGRPLAELPELFFAVNSVAREMRAMAPIFARGRAIPLPFEAPAKGMRARAWTYRGRDYLMLVNRTKDRQWKVPEEALERSWRPLFEIRREPRELLRKHVDAYYLRPYQVLMLESRLRPRRLIEAFPLWRPAPFDPGAPN